MAEEAAHVAERLLHEIARTGVGRPATCSMCLAASASACSRTTARDPEELMRHADVAMHTAKEHGGNGYRFYLPGMNARAVERLNLERDLRLALERQEFRLHYQPQFDVDSGNLIGAEALLRWDQPGARRDSHRGASSPWRRRPGSSCRSDSGSSARPACSSPRGAKEGTRLPRVAVNVSSAQFRAGILDTVQDAPDGIRTRAGTPRDRDHGIGADGGSAAGRCTRSTRLENWGCASRSTTSARATRRWPR